VARSTPGGVTAAGLAVQAPAGEPARPRPTLGARHVAAVCVGIVIGAGIFRAPSLVAGGVGDASIFMLAWIVGGALSIVGALCYAELASTWPSAGGDYYFLRRAFGPRIGFLYAWARLAVVQTGSIALLSFVVGDYGSRLLDLGPYGPAILAASTVAGLTALNWAGVRYGAESQLWLTALEVMAVLAVAAAGLLLVEPVSGAGGTTQQGSLGLVLVFVLLTYGGWSEAVFLAGELRSASRRMMTVLVGSLALVTLLYTLINLAYLRALGLPGIAGSHAVAADLMERAAGAWGAAAISLVVALSALTSANATTMTGARTTYALGCEFRGLGWLGRWSARRETPGPALLAQGAIALALVAAGAFSPDGFRLAVEYTAPVFWFFFLLVGLALFVLRRREPDVRRPFRVPLYPVLPAGFCLTSAYLLYSSVAYTGWSALAGVAVLAAGAVLLIFFQPRPQETMS
jgi:amino acid transporter